METKVKAIKGVVDQEDHRVSNKNQINKKRLVYLPAFFLF